MRTLTIGRGSNNDVVLQDSFVSGSHCSITLDEKGNFYLQDLGSSNGTYVNGKRVQQAWLRSNDIVKIGETVIPWQEYFESPNDSSLTGNVIKRISLGRAADNDAVIADDFVSSHHAEILATDRNEFLVRDLNSTNGTFVNDRRVISSLLVPGDRLRLARRTLEWTMFFSAPAHSETVKEKRAFQIWKAALISIAAVLLIMLGIWGISRMKNSSTNDERLNTSDTTLSAGSFSDVVKRTEQSVFMIESFDRYGNSVQGTGFFIGENGLGVTNYHVIQGGTKWVIKTIEGNTYELKDFVERNKAYDYAVFTIDDQGDFFRPLRRASTTPAKGDEIFVIGNPKGIESTVTKGIISGLKGGSEDEIMNGRFKEGDDFLQIDVAISHGSSGSPVLNMKGEVVGIATLSFQEADCINCNFALNAQMLKKFIEPAR
jgi:pSer/pThr/pTyr-binding forkhead associated (FHA) protein